MRIDFLEGVKYAWVARNAEGIPVREDDPREIGNRAQLRKFSACVYTNDWPGLTGAHRLITELTCMARNCSGR